MKFGDEAMFQPDILGMTFLVPPVTSFHLLLCQRDGPQPAADKTAGTRQSDILCIDSRSKRRISGSNEPLSSHRIKSQAICHDFDEDFSTRSSWSSLEMAFLISTAYPRNPGHLWRRPSQWQRRCEVDPLWE
jgi:hypothetical protein